MTDRTLRRPLSGVLAVASGAVALVLAGSIPASAAGEPIIENTHLQASYTHIEQEAHSGWCPQVPSPVEASGTISFGFLTRTQGPGGVWYFSGHRSSRDVYTNLDDGRTLTIKSTFRFADGRIVDNGDGTITIHAADTLSTVVFAGSTQVGQEAGRLAYTVVIDTMGTPGPDDDVLVSEEDHEPTGHFALEGIDCTTFERYLG
jgi:hypothetical protein